MKGYFPVNNLECLAKIFSHTIWRASTVQLIHTEPVYACGQLRICQLSLRFQVPKSYHIQNSH